MNSRPVLRGDHNQCPVCGELFNSSAAFDEHRIGKFADEHRGGRRCLSPGEMEEKGVRRGRGGFWKTRKGSGGSHPFAQGNSAS